VDGPGTPLTARALTGRSSRRAFGLVVGVAIGHQAQPGGVAPVRPFEVAGRLAGGGDEGAELVGVFASWLGLHPARDVDAHGVQVGDRLGDVLGPQAAETNMRLGSTTPSASRQSNTSPEPGLAPSISSQSAPNESNRDTVRSPAGKAGW